MHKESWHYKVTPAIAPDPCGSGCPVKALLGKKASLRFYSRKKGRLWVIRDSAVSPVTHLWSGLARGRRSEAQVKGECTGLIFPGGWTGQRACKLARFPLKSSSFSDNSYWRIFLCFRISACSAPHVWPYRAARPNSYLCIYVQTCLAANSWYAKSTWVTTLWSKGFCPNVSQALFLVYLA